MTKDEWVTEGALRFGPDRMQWKFVCPSCRYAAKASEWYAAGAPEGAIAFSCIGRWTGAPDKLTFRKAGGPCQYAGGGLFRLNPVTVTDGDVTHNLFDFA